jgi:hypothetical protein
VHRQRRGCGGRCTAKEATMSLRDPSPGLWKRMQAMGTTDAQAVARQYPDLLPGEERPPEKIVRGRTPAQNAQAASKRAKTGAKFEAELDDTHEWLTKQGFGHVLPHYPPTNKIPQQNGPPKLVYRKGGGPCDYSGHVNMEWFAHRASCKLAKYPGVDVVQRPVVFDAKTLGVKHASYRHNAEQIAQVKHLENAHAGGALAFLLVRADEVGRAFAIAYHLHADDLLHSRPITLFETIRTPNRTSEVFPLLPSCSYIPGKGWLWPSMLPWLL